jgi:hypothetical protein
MQCRSLVGALQASQIDCQTVERGAIFITNAAWKIGKEDARTGCTVVIMAVLLHLRIDQHQVEI